MKSQESGLNRKNKKPPERSKWSLMTASFVKLKKISLTAAPNLTLKC
jgi:hypothetical protein